MKIRVRSFPRAILAVFVAWLLPGVMSGQATSSSGPAQAVATISVEADQPLGPIGNLYNVGYNGWGDITYPGAIQSFNDLGVKFCRIQVNLKQICGDKPGDYRWDYVDHEDEGMTLVERVRQIIANGWTPLLAFSFHSSESKMPAWFKGMINDDKKDSWAHYNLDGTKVAKGYGNQLAAATTIAKHVAAYLASQGLKGLWWETIYEMDGRDPLVEIHHAVAEGVREADPSAKIVGPATWPGWSVEDAFVKPYLRKYGPDLLDAVSMHWYASCDHGFWKLRPGLMEGKTIMTMADRDLMTYLMNETPGYGTHVSSLALLLKDKKLNPHGKKIGIMYSEADVNATSYFHRNPENPNWPAYSAAADCWQNCNYFGGVWWASMLCHVAATGTGADVFKFNTRDFYGLIEVVPPDRAYRYPVWFAMKLLRDAGGLSAGRQMLQAAAAGAPMVEAFATGDRQGLSLIVINKSFSPQAADISVSGLSGDYWEATSYLFDQSRVASFQGKKPADKGGGTFQGYPDDDSPSAQSLKPVASPTCSVQDGRTVFTNVQCPPVSVVVIKLAPRS